MAKYRKKPVVVEAFQYFGNAQSNQEVLDLTKGSKTPAFMDAEIAYCSPENPEGFVYPVLKISTMEGDLIIRPGDWVIKGVHGEFYACKPDIFEATYELET
ncbi:MAG: hypothetical protein PHQ40_20275 [Anaerolineaceae bacterium]|nr:hypothetical protein [Anaerolineaceae bacterium]